MRKESFLIQIESGKAKIMNPAARKLVISQLDDGWYCETLKKVNAKKICQKANLRRYLPLKLSKWLVYIITRSRGSSNVKTACQNQQTKSLL